MSATDEVTVTEFLFHDSVFYVINADASWERWPVTGILFLLAAGKRDAIYKAASELKSIHVKTFDNKDEASAHLLHAYGNRKEPLASYDPYSVKYIH